jgi:CRP-like cAMP-binding protein
VLYKGGEAIKDVYFPSTGIVSLVTHLKENVTIEVGVIGRDGMAGIPVALGDDIAFEEAIVQIAGDAMRLSSIDLKTELNLGDSALQVQLLLYARRFMKQVAQTAACNRVHTIEQRLSRWMLMCRERMESNYLPLTQEFISNMLGTRREGVSTAAGVLQRKGLIQYSRGQIRILDKKGLEAFACECHFAIRERARRNGTRVNGRVAKST